MPRVREVHGYDVVTPFRGACDRCRYTTNVRVVASTIAPMRAPDQECVDRFACDVARQANREQKIRCFDRNGGRSFELPATDPHGRDLVELTDEQLRDVAGWCMLPEYHEAVANERGLRAAIERMAEADRIAERAQWRQEMRDEMLG